MDKGKLILTVEKILKGYTFWTSLFMLTYVAYYLQYLLTHFDFFSLIMSTFPETKNFVGRTMGFIFFFGAYNVLICGVIGISMLFIRDYRKLGLLGLFAAISFYGILYHIGDGL